MTTSTSDQITQKDFVGFLDRAAQRADTPASGKQTWFLAKLILDSDLKTGHNESNDWIIGADSRSSLSKARASQLISLYLN